MAKIDSEETRKQLIVKLGCKEDRTGDHICFTLEDQDGIILGNTKISHGPRHDIGDGLIKMMSRQLRLGTSANLKGLVDCTKTRDECLKIIRDLSR